MSQTRPMTWLLVGTGDIVRKRVGAAISTARGGRVVGVVGGRQRAQGLADQFGGEAFEGLDQALARSDAEAVYIATPVDRHADEAVRALESGRHVLVEKPLGVNRDEAQRVVEAARQARKTAGCAYYRRAFPRYEHLRNLVDEERLGRIVLIRACFWGWFSPAADDPKHWRVERARGGGGPLADMGSHMLDQIIGLFGLPRTVFARTDTLVQDFAVEDSSALILTFENGAQVTASFGWNSKTWRHEMEVIGSEGKVLWSPADAEPVTVTMGREVEELDLPSAENVHQPLVEDFVDAVREGRAPLVPVAEAAKTNRLLDAVYQSAAEGKEVTP